MMLPRFYFEGSISTGSTIILPEASSRHLASVLRLKINEQVLLFNGQGGEYTCEIVNIGKKQVELIAHEFASDNRRSRIEVNLGLSVLKKDAMDRVIARAVETGSSSITPVIAEHTTVAKKIIANRQGHWQQIVVSACEQCGLNIIPELKPALTFNDWLEEANADLKLIALGSGERLAAHNDTSTVALMIGPEGGFTRQEISGALKKGFVPVRFGPRILRAETAPLVAISALRHALDDD